MQIIHGEKGYSIYIDIKGSGFVESKWYKTKEKLMQAIANNEIKWNFRFDKNDTSLD